MSPDQVSYWGMVGTWAAVILALTVASLDGIIRICRHFYRRRFIAAATINAVQLCVNNCRSQVQVLEALTRDDMGRLYELGYGMQNPHVEAVRQFAADADVLGKEAAEDLAYGLSLIYGMERWGKHLMETGPQGDAGPWDMIKDEAEFQAEAARQAAESFANVEKALKGLVSTRIMERRFGPAPKSD